MAGIAILGAGMAGFGAAHRLHTAGVGSVLFEKKSYIGGHAASFKHNGFVFDDGPHVSFTKNERLRKLFAESVKHEYEEFQANVSNYWKGHWIKHPAICNLYGLPQGFVVDILSDFINTQSNEYGEVENYEDWLIASYGKTFAEAFPIQYGLKFHTTKARNMSVDWIGPRLYKPDLKEVLHGALSPATPDVHYISDFRYPSRGGFVSYLDMFIAQTDLRLNHNLVNLDWKNCKLMFANGIGLPYEFVISSIPLPDLIPMISGVPADVLEASQMLACSSCVLVDIGINREDISDNHWIYFYDNDFSFTRLSFPHMQSRFNAPPGSGSIQAEVYYSKKYKPLDMSAQNFIQPVISDLKQCGLMHEDDKILYVSAKNIPYANVIFDLDRAPALKIIHDYLDEAKIFYCGRYGEWGYLWTDQSFISGENAAQKILNMMSKPKDKMI